MTPRLPPDVDPAHPQMETAMNDTRPDLVTQSTAAPTRKMAAVGVAAVVGTALTGIIVTALPDLSVACGEELGGVLAPMIGAAATGGLAWFTGYRTRERKSSAP